MDTCLSLLKILFVECFKFALEHFVAFIVGVSSVITAVATAIICMIAIRSEREKRAARNTPYVFSAFRYDNHFRIAFTNTRSYGITVMCADIYCGSSCVFHELPLVSRDYPPEFVPAGASATFVCSIAKDGVPIDVSSRIVLTLSDGTLIHSSPTIFRQVTDQSFARQL